MLKGYERDNEALKLLKEAIDVFAEGESKHDELSRNAHMLQLQGFKRWHRVNSKEDREKRVMLQHYVIDIFEENLEPSWDYEGVNASDIKEHLDSYIEWERIAYNSISNIANKLTLLEYNNEAKIISECLCDVSKEICKIQRWLADFKYTDYDTTYIKFIDKCLHDKIKKIEE